MMRVPLSSGAPSARRITYEYDIGDDRCEPLEIILRGVYEAGSECSVPPEKIQTIGIEGVD